MIQLSDHFTFRKLLRFPLPSMIMLVFTSVYIVVDGFFVSNFVGKTPFTAVNFIMPFLLILGCVGFMFGTGGGALIAKTIGEGNHEKANQIFSLLVYVSIGVGLFLGAFGILFLRPIAAALGGTGQLLEDSVTYVPFICWLPLPMWCNMNFNVSLPRRKSPIWASIPPLQQGLPTSFWMRSLW